MPWPLASMRSPRGPSLKNLGASSSFFFVLLYSSYYYYYIYTAQPTRSTKRLQDIIVAITWPPRRPSVVCCVRDSSSVSNIWTGPSLSSTKDDWESYCVYRVYSRKQRFTVSVIVSRQLTSLALRNLSSACRVTIVLVCSPFLSYSPPP